MKKLIGTKEFYKTVAALALPLLLQNAISTLRTLHKMDGRHVGIISHVEELREKIPVQIRVEQDAKSSSSRVVVV